MLSLHFVRLGREWQWQVFVLRSTNSLFSLNTECEPSVVTRDKDGDSGSVGSNCTTLTNIVHLWKAIPLSELQCPYL